MKNGKTLAHIFILLCLTQISSAGTITLSRAYFSAVKNMEDIQEADLVVEQKKQVKKQALAAMQPVVSGFGAYTKIDPPEGAGANPFLLTRQYNAGLRLSVPLIRGGAWSAYKFAKESVFLSKNLKKLTHLSIYQTIIDLYYQSQALKSDLVNLKELLLLSEQRMKEIDQRVRIGRSRKAELVEAIAQKHTVEAQIDELNTSFNNLSLEFEFYTKFKAQDVQELKSLEIPQLTESLDELLKRAYSRPDLLSSIQEISLSERQVGIAKGGYYPRLDLNTNYYLSRTGILSTSDWDVGLSVSIPLYQGGGVSSAVKEAVAGKRIAQLKKSKIHRFIENEVTSSYENHFQLKKQFASLKKALEKSKESYELAKRDYGFGLVTNLDVLRSMNLYIDTKRSLQRTLFLIHQNFQQLKAKTGYYPQIVTNN